MPKCVIRAVEFASGAHCPHAGQYLKTANFEAYDGRGYMTFTEDVAEALVFPDVGSALKFWKTRSRVRPTRPDGKPNRPLTALTVSIEEYAR